MHAYNKLWTKTAFAKVPAIGAQEKLGDDAIAYVKFFSVLNGWAWYIIEYNTETGEAFGLVQGAEVELGPIIVREVNEGDWSGEDMQSLNNGFKGRFIMPPYERDAHYQPMTLGKIRERIANGKRP